jgi:hypothetical protein
MKEYVVNYCMGIQCLVEYWIIINLEKWYGHLLEPVKYMWILPQQVHPYNYYTNTYMQCHIDVNWGARDECLLQIHHNVMYLICLPMAWPFYHMAIPNYLPVKLQLLHVGNDKQTHTCTWILFRKIWLNFQRHYYYKLKNFSCTCTQHISLNMCYMSDQTFMIS